MDDSGLMSSAALEAIHGFAVMLDRSLFLGDRHLDSLRVTMLSISAWHVFVRNCMLANFKCSFAEDESPVKLEHEI